MAKVSSPWSPIPLFDKSSTDKEGLDKMTRSVKTEMAKQDATIHNPCKKRRQPTPIIIGLCKKRRQPTPIIRGPCKKRRQPTRP